MKNFLLLDECKFFGDEFSTRKTIPKNTVFFEGHYPGNPILPGVFHLELASITARKFLLETRKIETHLVKISKYRFFKSVLPGEIITIKVHLKESVEIGFVMSVSLYSENEQVSSGIIVMAEKNLQIQNIEALLDMDFQSACMSLDKIIQILPHRYPFVQLDKVIKIIGMEKIIGIKNISASDYMLWGRDILAPYPKSIMIEALSQCAGILGLQLMTKKGSALFGSITNAVFAGSAYPGDQLILEASVIRALSDSCIMSGRIFVKNQLICEVENMVSAVR